MKTRHQLIIEFVTAYPNYFIDAQGTVWTSREAVYGEFSGGDAWMDEILGCFWEDALDNFEEKQRIAKQIAFWKAHKRLKTVCWWTLRHYRAVSLFLRLVWRWSGYVDRADDYRFSTKEAWGIAASIWLNGGGE